jgi:hypothetical protein
LAKKFGFSKKLSILAKKIRKNVSNYNAASSNQEQFNR